MLSRLSENGSYGRVAPGKESIVIGAFGDREMLKSLSLEELAGVEKVLPIRKPYKLVSADSTPEPTVIQVGGRRLGGDHFGLIAGPCTVESREQTHRELPRRGRRRRHACSAAAPSSRAPRRTASRASDRRGSRSSPRRARSPGCRSRPRSWTRARSRRSWRRADVLQIGARNMQNFLLLAEVGKTDKPVLLKRGASASLEELLMAAEYILKEGNPRVILCERGIKTFERSTRFTLDISAVPVLKEETHLPVIVDPSHAAGPARAGARARPRRRGRGRRRHHRRGASDARGGALRRGLSSSPPRSFAEFADDITRLVGFMGKTVG